MTSINEGCVARSYKVCISTTICFNVVLEILVITHEFVGHTWTQAIESLSAASRKHGNYNTYKFSSPNTRTECLRALKEQNPIS